MNEIEEEIKRRSLYNKNYLWIVSIIILAVSTVTYSYHTNSGIVSKLSISQNSIALNQISREIVQNEEQTNNLKDTKENDTVAQVEQNETTINLLNLQSFQNNNFAQDIEEIIFIKERKNNAIEEVTKNTLTTNAYKTKEEEIIKEEEPIKTSLIVNATQKDSLPQQEIKKEESKISFITEKELDFTFITCTDFQTLASSITQNCIAKIDKFLEENTNASKFEVIGLIDYEDIRNLSSNTIANQRRLGVQRIASAKEYIKIKSNSPMSNHSFYLKNDFQKFKGFILRAYF